MFSRRLLIIVSVVTILAGCEASLYIPAESDAAKVNIPLDTLIAGRQLYVNKCGNCHNLYLPSIHTQTEWSKILDEMQDKAKVTHTEKGLILKYLGTNYKK